MNEDKLKCQCGCGKDVSPGVKWILVSLERYMKKKLRNEDYELDIHSGGRCPTHNKAEGGVKNSAHAIEPLSLGVDLGFKTSTERYYLTKYLFKHVPLKRIGDSWEKKLIHFDIATGKLQYPSEYLTEYPQYVYWGYD